MDSKGTLYFSNGTEWKPLGEVKDITEVLPEENKYDADKNYMSLFTDETLTLTVKKPKTKKQREAWKKLLPGYREFKRNWRRYCKWVARQKRRRAYLFRAYIRAKAYRERGITETYYNGEVRKLMVVIKDKWSLPL